MAQLDENPILELGRNPIAGDNPCGTDVADDEQYIFVLDEIAKMDRIEADEPDWYGIEQSATNILAAKSKDAEIASALGFALFKRCRYAGLAAALGLLNEMVRTFWDNLFPERPRRRKARIETLTDRFGEGGWLRDNQPQPDDFDGIDACVVRAAELKAVLTERMPDDPPDFAKFERGIKEHAAKRPKPAEAAAPAPGGEAATTAAGGATFAAGEVSDLGGALNAILGAAAFIRKADLTDPVPYAVNRIIKWSKIQLPVADGARYQIEPPDASVIDALTHQHANGLWEHLLKGAEAAFRSSDPLWLDLQRYVCAAMSGLGPTYENARQAVMSETAGLVNRLGSGLYELKFRTGTALCGGETRMWIESEVTPAQGGGGGGLGGGQSDGRLGEALGKAKKLTGSGKLKEALQELREGLVACTQRRERFLWRLSIAQLCCDAQRLQLAAPLLEECYEEIRRYHIEEWEPTLAVEVAQTLYRCRKALTSAEKEPAPEALQRVRDSFAWLCQLDPLAALAAEPSGN